MPIARVEEEVGGLGRAGELAGGVDVALAGEDRVVLHAVDLHLVGEAELLGVRHPVLDGREGASVEEIRRMDGVPRRPQLVGERVEARRLALGGVVERVLEFLP